MIRALVIILLSVQLSALEFLGVDYSQSDKQGHFWLGAAVSGVSMLALDHWKPTAPWYTRALVGIGSATIVGIGKEYADSRDPLHHTTDRNDAVATITGGSIVALSLSWSF